MLHRWFYIFTKEKIFREYEKNPEKLKELKKDYEDMLDRMDLLVKSGEMTAYEQGTIIDMTKRVLNSIARKYHKVREGVNHTMGGVNGLLFQGRQIVSEQALTEAYQILCVKF